MTNVKVTSLSFLKFLKFDIDITIVLTVRKVRTKRASQLEKNEHFTQIKFLAQYSKIWSPIYDMNCPYDNGSNWNL